MLNQLKVLPNDVTVGKKCPICHQGTVQMEMTDDGLVVLCLECCAERLATPDEHAAYDRSLGLEPVISL